MTNLDKVHLCYINPKRIQITLFQKCYPNKNHPPQLRKIVLKNTVKFIYIIDRNEHNTIYI